MYPVRFRTNFSLRLHLPGIFKRVVGPEKIRRLAFEFVRELTAYHDADTKRGSVSSDCYRILQAGLVFDFSSDEEFLSGFLAENLKLGINNPSLAVHLTSSSSSAFDSMSLHLSRSS